MIRELVRCAKSEDNPLNKLIETMAKEGPKDNGWNKLLFTSLDISEMEKFLSIMEPFEFLCTKMGSEFECTVQRLFPTLQELVMLLEKIVEDEEETASEFAKVCLCYHT